jgi:hypothetical protein
MMIINIVLNKPISTFFCKDNIFLGKRDHGWLWKKDNPIHPLPPPAGDTGKRRAAKPLNN